jgi:hypothetical protein
MLIYRLSGEEDHHAETLETLKFAGNCARVETKAKKNIVSYPTLEQVPADLVVDVVRASSYQS